MKKLFILLFIFSSIFSMHAEEKKLKITGYARNYTGSIVGDKNENEQTSQYSMVQNTLNLKLEHSRDDLAIKINPYIYQYPSQDIEFNIREAYIQKNFETVDITLGKQQIVWGKADGVFITDVVSPKDLSEFLLRDFEEIRMGVTSLKIDWALPETFIEEHNLSIVLIPIFTGNIMPKKDSIWYPSLPFPIEPIINDTKEVEQKFENSEAFIKYSATTSAIDFELMGGYMFSDDPTMHISKTMNMTTHQLTAITIDPEYHRLALAGGSFSTTLGGLVLRGEAAYYNGKYFNTEDPLYKDTTIQKNYIHYLIGLDYTILGVKLKLQFIQEAIIDYEEAMKKDEFSNTITFMMTKDFFRETLYLELFAYVGLPDSSKMTSDNFDKWRIDEYDALLRPKITYKMADGFEIILGGNIFLGDKEGNFGQYDKNDMIYSKVKYSF